MTDDEKTPNMAESKRIQEAAEQIASETEMTYGQCEGLKISQTDIGTMNWNCDCCKQEHHGPINVYYRDPSLKLEPIFEVKLCGECFGLIVKIASALTMGDSGLDCGLFDNALLDDLVSQRIVGVINRAINADKDAMEALFNVRVRCNETLAADPTIQVDSQSVAPYVGIIGLIGGIAGSHPNGSSKVAMSYQHTTCSGTLTGLHKAVVTGRTSRSDLEV
jgi:hypothetical protein